MKIMKKRLFSILALICLVVTGAWADTTYELTKGLSDNGTIAFKVDGENATTAKEGDEVTVVVTPEEGWVVTEMEALAYNEWNSAKSRQQAPEVTKKVTLTAVADVENTWTFTMPGGNVVVNATIRKALKDAWIQALEDRTYNGEAQTQTVTVIDGTTTLTEGTDYTVSYANNTNAGTATVTVKAVADHATYCGEAKATFKIEKSNQMSYTAPTACKLVYTGEPQNLIVAGAANPGPMVYSLIRNEYTTAIPQGTDAGNYPVFYTVKETDNYYGLEVGCVIVTIEKAAATLTTAPQALELVYSGEAQALVSAGETADGEVQYSLDGENWSADIPTATEVGTYTVYYQVIGDNNHKNIKPASIEVAIAENPNPEPTNVIPVQTETEPVATVDGESFYHLGLTEETAAQVSTVADMENPSEFLQNLGLTANAQGRIIPTETGLQATQGTNIRLALKNMPANYILTFDFSGKIRLLKGALVQREAKARRNAADVELVDDQAYNITETGDVIIELETVEAPVEIHKITLRKDDVLTGISAINNGQVNTENWYDLNGRKVNGQTLKKGVYVRNGKKIVVK